MQIVENIVLREVAAKRKRRKLTEANREDLERYKPHVKNTFIQFLRDGNVQSVSRRLKDIERHASQNNDIENAELWFHLPSDSTLAESISDIIRELQSDESSKNRQYLIQRLEDIVDGSDFSVYYS